MNFIALMNCINGEVIGFSVSIEHSGTTGRHVGTFALSSALNGEERQAIGVQIAKLIETSPERDQS